VQKDVPCTAVAQNAFSIPVFKEEMTQNSTPSGQPTGKNPKYDCNQYDVFVDDINLKPLYLE
jgi:hypothetical protein